MNNFKKLIIGFLKSISLILLTTLFFESALAEGLQCTGEEEMKMIDLAVLGATKAARSESYEPRIEKRMQEIDESIALLENVRGEMKGILEVWNTVQAAAVLTQATKTTADIITDLCRLNCPEALGNVVDFRDKAFEFLKESGYIKESEVLPDSWKNSQEEFMKIYPDKDVKNFVTFVHNFTNNIKTTITLVEDAEYDETLKKNLKKNNADIGKLKQMLAVLKSKLATAKQGQSQFIDKYAKMLKESFVKHELQVSCEGKDKKIPRPATICDEFSELDAQYDKCRQKVKDMWQFDHEQCCQIAGGTLVPGNICLVESSDSLTGYTNVSPKVEACEKKRSNIRSQFEKICDDEYQKKQKEKIDEYIKDPSTQKIMFGCFGHVLPNIIP